VADEQLTHSDDMNDTTLLMAAPALRIPQEQQDK